MILPLISVITPTFNRADYLSETIESVLSQNYPNLEYLIIDDGSTDNTIEILEKYSDRIIWESQKNLGETRTVNKGIGLSHGEIILIVNSDDPLLPNSIFTGVDFLLNNPEILVAYPDWIKIGPNSEIIEHVQVPEFNYFYMLKQHHCIVGPGAFIKREAFELVGFRDPSFKYVADFDFWLRLGIQSNFSRIPKELATFRIHSNSASVSSKGIDMANEHIRLIKKIYSLPNLPILAKNFQSEAFSWAYIVASEMSFPSSWVARKNKLIAFFYNPLVFGRIYFRKFKVWLRKLEF